MLKQTLSAERARELFSYDPETGLLTWKVDKYRARKGGVAGYQDPSGYTKIVVDQQRYWAHRVVWLIHTGEWPTGEIDHINGSPSDNRICNLRDIAHQTNIENQRKAHARSTTGFLGIEAHQGRFRAKVVVDGKANHIGVFDTPEAAHAAYVDAKRQLHSGCTL